MKKFREVFIIVAVILLILAIVYIPRIFGAKPGVFSQDLVAIAWGIPISLALIGVLGLIASLWDYTIGKVAIVVVIIAIIVICAIIFWREGGKRRNSLSLLFLYLLNYNKATNSLYLWIIHWSIFNIKYIL